MTSEATAMREFVADNRNGRLVFRDIGAWRVGLSRLANGSDSIWFLSTQLIDASKSTSDDWAELGEIAEDIGAPEDPVRPIEECEPGEVFHWVWAEDASGTRVERKNEPSTVEFVRRAIARARGAAASG